MTIDYFINFCMTFGGLYIFDKSLDLHPKRKRLCLYLLVAAMVVCIYDWLELYHVLDGYTLPLLLNFLAVWGTQLCCSRVGFKVSLGASLFSLGLSCGIGAVLALPAELLASVTTNIFHDTFYNGYSDLLAVFWLLLYIIAVFLLFKIKRFSHGFAFLRKVKSAYVDFILCLFILLFYSLATVDVATRATTYGAIVVVAFLLLLLFLWWRENLTQIYKERQRNKELEYAKAIVQSRELEIEKLKADNTALAAIIHKDNKLIPALQNAARMGTSDEVAMQAQTLLAERVEAVEQYRVPQKPIRKTGRFLIDSMLEYMYTRAAAEGVAFEVEIDMVAEDSIDKFCDEKDLCTLAADLCENALIAVAHGERDKAVRCVLALEQGTLTLSVYDSGIPFEQATLFSLGEIPVTTHADEGGHGIGMMTVFELLK